MVSKHILPWFGGVPTVWTTCLLFFQVLLLGGYGLAHLSVTRIGIRRQAVVYILLLVGAALVPILPGDNWQPSGSASPTLSILRMLAVSVGPPFLVLAASGPILQTWFSRVNRGGSPYHLYAVSNTGSLVALISYPLVIEPVLRVGTQARVWSLLFIGFIVACSAAAWQLWKTEPGEAVDGAKREQPAAPRVIKSAHFQTAMSILWAACGTILFMSVTNQLTLNIASVPFLWIVPLSIYLLSFIVAFSGERWYPRRICAVLLVAAFAVFYLLLPGEISRLFIVVELAPLLKIAMSALALFVCCMVCHGELYRLRPVPAQLTKYYLSISFGGAVGGVVVAVVAPFVFLLLQELQLGLLLCGLLYLITLFYDPTSPLCGGRPRFAWTATILGLLTMFAVSLWLTNLQLRGTVFTTRNFFGLIRVVDQEPDAGLGPVRIFYHGTTIHGWQLLDPESSQVPTSYYGPATGFAAVMRATRQAEGGRRIGVVGMGAASLVVYGNSNDHFEFYELDPDVVQVAESEFTYLKNTRASWDVQLGDGRLRLEENHDQNFDVLILDAFNSDAVPVHMLTLEAMAIYDRHLHPQGIIVVNVTNIYVDLAPIVYHMAYSRQFNGISIRNRRDKGGTSQSAGWIVLTRSRETMEKIVAECEPVKKAGLMDTFTTNPSTISNVRPWTDDFSNLLQILR